MCTPTGVVEPSPETSTRTRYRILAAAEHLIDDLDTPFGGLQPVADATYIDRRAIYRHYATREDLVRALARRWKARREAECGSGLDDVTCFGEALGWLARHPRRARFLAVESVRSANEDSIVVLDVLPDLDSVAQAWAASSGESHEAALAAVHRQVAMVLGAIVYGSGLGLLRLEDVDHLLLARAS